MSREALIEKVIKAINELSVSKGEEVSDFIEFLIRKHESELLNDGISKLIASSKSF